MTRVLATIQTPTVPWNLASSPALLRARLVGLFQDADATGEASLRIPRGSRYLNPEDV